MLQQVKKSFTQPGRTDVHVNRPLTNISIAFMQNSNNFIASRVFPNIPVGKKSDSYFEFERGEFNRDEAQERAPSTESAGGTYKISNTTYNCRVYGYHKDVADQVRDNADSPLNPDREATEFVTMKALIRREVDWVDTYFPSTAHAPGGVWTFDVDGDTTATAAASFDPTSASDNNKVFWNLSNSTPIEDIRLLKRFVLESTGFEPNILTVGRPVYDVLLDHPDIVGRLDSGQTPGGPAIATRQSLARLLEVDEVLVMNAIRNTAAEGQTASHSFIGGKNALLSYRPTTPGLLTPSAGYTFSWTGHVGAGDDGIAVSRFRMQNLRADRIEMEMAWDQKKISADLGAFFDGIVQ